MLKELTGMRDMFQQVIVRSSRKCKEKYAQDTTAAPNKLTGSQGRFLKEWRESWQANDGGKSYQASQKHEHT